METIEGKTIKRDRGPHKSRNKSDSSAEDLISLRERNDLSPRRMEWVKALSKENVELRANLAAEKEKNKQFRTEYATLMAEFTSMKAQLKDALDQLHFYRNSTGSDGMGDIPSPLLSPISVTGSRIAGKDLEIREDENGKRIVTAGKPDGLLNALFDSSNESEHLFL
jgi:uncharacterized phage infection (PIP) family protein YhgE